LRLGAVVLIVVGVACARGPRAELPAAERPVHVAANAPVDQPIGVANKKELEELFAMLEPCRRLALAAWPDARRRFATGLPERHTMFVTMRLRDAAGRVEQVFVAVDAIRDGRVSGRLWNDLNTVEGYRRGQALSLAEADVVDWTIARPDGTEEGNWMGRFIDGVHATGRPPTGICGP
jgi:hypothetical protein